MILIAAFVNYGYGFKDNFAAKYFPPQVALQQPASASKSVAIETFDELSQGVAPPVDLRSLATAERKG
ncbi:hypothetical protein [Bradyrhizobium retamae]|uniref:hypothetical protein n=1 Tax=Bradyrhizobium retamae TaxID=1300035 RepID=UPI0018D23798|nr:hypothetical protein [Bradyrhizobium retamae]